MNRVAIVLVPQITAKDEAGEQKSIRQPRRRGRRVNIFGVWEPKVRFDYALMLGTLQFTNLRATYGLAGSNCSTSLASHRTNHCHHS